MKKLLLTAVLAATGIAFAPSAASAAGAENCAEANPLTAPIVWYRGGEDSRLSYVVSPSDAFSGTGMAGKTVKVTVTGKTKAKLPLAFFSYKTQSAKIESAWPQELFDRDQVVLDGCETVTLEVAVPNCNYQIDFLYMGPGHPLLNEYLKEMYPELLGDLPILPPIPGLPDFKKLEPRPDGTTEQDVQDALYPSGGLINANLGGGVNCFPPTPPPPPPPGPPTPPNPPTTPKPPVLPPVVTGATTVPPLKGASKKSKRACSSVTAKSYRVRAKQKNTITVRVKTTSKTRPKVKLKGAGISTSKRVSSKGTVTFKVKPKRSGSIRVTASGCTKVAKVKVLSAKKAAKSGTSPTFTG
jgi:hypothetical protein